MLSQKNFTRLFRNLSFQTNSAAKMGNNSGDGSGPVAFVKNVPSVRLRPAVVLEKFAKEVSLGRMVGPFSYPPIANLCVSPLGLVFKIRNRTSSA